MSTKRSVQVGTQVRRELMDVIQRDLKDPRLGLLSITRVEMSSDLRTARVHVSSIPGRQAGEGRLQARLPSYQGPLEAEASQPPDLSPVLAALNAAKGRLRHELGRRLENLRYTPDLVFMADPTIEYSVRIAAKLRRLVGEAGPADDPPGRAGAEEPN